jgi:2-keto-4-pentenoate hydratase/2-oxohepta-3-ene-1,7-dioic acid hydratase in catechol pathway
MALHPQIQTILFCLAKNEIHFWVIAPRLKFQKVNPLIALTEDALNHVLGYSIFNDGSVREWQKHSIYAGKNFANSGSWGPWITTTESLPPVEEMALTVNLNGETVQSAFGREMIFNVAQQIAYASSLFSLHPGDVIATGSPDGTGGSRTPKRYLQKEDVLSISVSGVGTISNTIGLSI